MLTLKDIDEEMSLLNGWSLEADAITKVFIFQSFKEALEFVNKVGEIAEKYNHHPDILMNYDSVRLSLTTYAEHGLTKKDFEVAKEIDVLGEAGDKSQADKNLNN